MCKTLRLFNFIACCLGAIKPQRKLEVVDPVGPGETILSGAVPFGAPRWQANLLGMSHPLG
jgi:hypothetical protein